MTVFERDHIRLLLLTLAAMPLAGVITWWLLVLAFRLGSDVSALWALGIGLTVVGAGALVAFARRRGIDVFWVGASVLAFVVATAGWGLVSFGVVLFIACRAGCG